MRIGRVTKIGRAKGGGVIIQPHRQAIPFHPDDCENKPIPDEGATVAFLPGIDFQGKHKALKLKALKIS